MARKPYLPKVMSSDRTPFALGHLIVRKLLSTPEVTISRTFVRRFSVRLR